MNAILIDPSDNVVTLTEAAKPGSTAAWEGGEVEVKDDVPFGHKVAIVDLEQGTEVVKYGAPIGHVNCRVGAGGLVHTAQMDTRGSAKVLEGEG